MTSKTFYLTFYVFLKTITFHYTNILKKSKNKPTESTIIANFNTKKPCIIFYLRQQVGSLWVFFNEKVA